MTRSLRMRLIVWILALLLPASAAAGWLLVQVFANRLIRDIDVALEEEAETTAEVIEESRAPDSLPALLARVSGETDLGAGKQVVVRRAGIVIGEAPTGAAAFLATRAPRSMRIATYRTGPSDAPLTVVVGVPAAAAEHATHRLTLLLIAGIPLSVLLLTGGLWAIAGRALRPLEAAARGVDAIGVGDLTARVPVDNPNDEVGRMVAALNRMLDRVAQSVTEIQRFTADAAHELRTPLAVLRAGLEVTLARDRAAAEYRAALADALGETQRLEDLAENLLTLARLEAAVPTAAAARVAVAEVLRDLADAWEARAASRGVAIDVACAAPLTVRGNSADLYRLFGNLIDNAVRHSPEAGCVRLEAHADAGSVGVAISDEGPGLSAVDAAHAFDRFYRGRNESGGGSGLGLSIAQAITRAHGGDIRLVNRDGRGCVALVRLPAA